MLRFIPVLLFIGLTGLFLAMLTTDRNPQEIKSALVGKTMPAFELPDLFGGAAVDSATLVKNKPVVVNFFASWCIPCRAEHENLMELAKDSGIELVGIAYKDKPDDARGFLAEMGNPFERAATDIEGRTAIEFGVSGVPETFVVSTSGEIVYRHWGPIVGDSLDAKLRPQLELQK